MSGRFASQPRRSELPTAATAAPPRRTSLPYCLIVAFNRRDSAPNCIIRRLVLTGALSLVCPHLEGRLALCMPRATSSRSLGKASRAVNVPTPFTRTTQFILSATARITSLKNQDAATLGQLLSAPDDRCTNIPRNRSASRSLEFVPRFANWPCEPHLFSDFYRAHPLNHGAASEECVTGLRSSLEMTAPAF